MRYKKCELFFINFLAKRLHAKMTKDVGLLRYCQCTMFNFALRLDANQLTILNKVMQEIS